MEPNQANADSPETVDVAAQAVSSSTPDGDTNQVVTENNPGDFDAQLAAADSPDGIAKLINSLSATAPAPAVVDAGKEDENQPGDAKPKGEEDDGPLDLTKLPTRFRSTMREEDDVGRLAMSLKHRNKDWTLEDAVQAARKQLGKEVQAAPAPVAAATQNAPTPETAKPAVDELAGIEAKIAEVKAQRKAAMANVELEKVAELDEQLDTLKDQRAEAKTAPKAADKQGKPAVAPDYDAAFDASLAKVADLYPFMRDPESEGAKRMVEIDAELEAKQDPLFRSPDKPFEIAKRVAAEMAAPKVVKTATPAKEKQVTPRSLAPIASGASRTTTTRTQDASSAAEIVSIKTPEDLERYLAKQAGARI